MILFRIFLVGVMAFTILGLGVSTAGRAIATFGTGTIRQAFC